jgi:cobaltochelatase CobN
MRTGGDDVAEVLALLGCRPVWAAEGKRVVGVELVADDELGRPRVDVVVRISGFFRDAFPGLIDLMDDARRLAFPERTDPAIFGSAPGTYGAGMLPLLDGRNWESDEDLAEVYVAWGGYAYGRGISGVPAADALRQRLSHLDVAVKNQDNREHDIFDSDDYFQYHGGMIATVRALTGRDPKAYFGDSADPARPVVRGLDEEARRVVRSRVLNPRWLSGMRRHGYKGAFEMAATVDYLFGYDATAHVIEDWMYQEVTERYLLEPENRAFLDKSNPWAFRAMAERLFEAVDRGLWAEPPTDLVERLREAYLSNEAGLEAGGMGGGAAGRSGSSQS